MKKTYSYPTTEIITLSGNDGILQDPTILNETASMTDGYYDEVKSNTTHAYNVWNDDWSNN